MARMHPEDVEDLENATIGEGKVFRCLQAVARPDSVFFAWYEPAIGEQIDGWRPQKDRRSRYSMNIDIPYILD